MPERPDDAARDHRALGRALRELRIKAGITQEELGARAGIGATYLSQVENGHRGVRWHTVTRVLTALDADLHQLADAIGRPEPLVRRRIRTPRL
jgi:transcriptional regulator with XRE-family HTH domain